MWKETKLRVIATLMCDPFFLKEKKHLWQRENIALCFYVFHQYSLLFFLSVNILFSIHLFTFLLLKLDRDMYLKLWLTIFCIKCIFFSHKYSIFNVEFLILATP